MQDLLNSGDCSGPASRSLILHKDVVRILSKFYSLKTAPSYNIHRCFNVFELSAPNYSFESKLHHNASIRVGSIFWLLEIYYVFAHVLLFITHVSITIGKEAAPTLCFNVVEDSEHSQTVFIDPLLYVLSSLAVKSKYKS
jgi:hypothetical protein